MPDSSPAVPQPRLPLDPTVSFERRVTSGISLEVLAAFHAIPPSGNEAGGILLGTRSGEPILVADFEPVLCEHRFGPSYALSDEDLRGLEESVQWFRTSPADGLQVLGFYRSHVGPDPSIDERDDQLMRRFFPEAGSLFLLLKPGRGETITAELFVQAEGGLRPAGHPMLFPSEGIAAMRIPAGAASDKADVRRPSPAADIVPRPMLPPAHPRRLETQEIAGRNWTWAAAVAALTIAAAILGYQSVAPKNVEPAPEAIPGASSAPQTPASDPMPARAPGTAQRTAAATDPLPATDTPTQPAIPSETEKGIRDAFARWERAVRSGDPDLIAACYASQVDQYFKQRNSSPDEVRRATVQSVARYGKPVILRISNLTVTPVSEDRGIASFRKRWQTSGPRIFAGEEQERLTFIKTADAWKIASEEETKVYWTQRPRV